MNTQARSVQLAVECPSVAIVIVNWRTFRQTRLCLRLLRKYTNYPRVEIIVVENDPNHKTAAYLRSLPWITYIENDHSKPDHRNGLDLGIRHACSDYILIMHTDTFVRRGDWLQRLLSRMEGDTFLLGSQDRLIRPLPWYLRFDDYFRRRKLEKRWGKKGQIPKIISHCALFRRELFTEHGQRFDFPAWIDGIYNDTGEFIQRYCEENGLGVVYLRRKHLAPLLWHIEGATLNITRGKQPLKRRLRAWRFYRQKEIRHVLNNAALDS